MRLSWIDLTIVVGYVAATILAGVLARRSIRGIADFLVAGRSLGTHMGAASMISTGLGKGVPNGLFNRHSSSSCSHR